MKTPTEVLIIGGGVIGACCALYLTRLGKQVTLVERTEICSEASRGNACWVAAGYALPMAMPGVMGQGVRWMFDSSSPFYIKPRFDFSLLAKACKIKCATGANDAATYMLGTWLGSKGFRQSSEKLFRRASIGTLLLLAIFNLVQ